MDEESFRKFYPEQWSKQQQEKETDTATQHVDPQDVLLQRFAERKIEENRTAEQEKLKEEFKGLSNLKKDMVRRKIKKLQRRQMLHGKSSS